MLQALIDLSKGLGWERIKYYYQPLYNTVTGQIDKAEILTRYPNNMGGYFDAEELVTQAEEVGLIDEMDHRAFIHACGVLPEFQAHGIRQLSVNLSPAACQAARLIPEVSRILEAAHVAAGDICLEITEVAKLLDEASLFQTLRVLYDMGFKLALDDFGKGYSNLQRLINAPFHIIKLDKSLVWGIDERSVAGPLINSLIQFAKENQITVVAEGIETAEQAQVLTQMGCHYLQGYFFGRPMTKESLLELADRYQNSAAAVYA